MLKIIDPADAQVFTTQGRINEGAPRSGKSWRQFGGTAERKAAAKARLQPLQSAAGQSERLARDVHAFTPPAGEIRSTVGAEGRSLSKGNTCPASNLAEYPVVGQWPEG